MDFRVPSELYLFINSDEVFPPSFFFFLRTSCMREAGELGKLSVETFIN